jgi:hypothetical protein
MPRHGAHPPCCDVLALPCPPQDNLLTDLAKRDWGVQQILTSANWGGVVGNFFTGGLNLQVGRAGAGAGEGEALAPGRAGGCGCEEQGAGGAEQSRHSGTGTRWQPPPGI